MKLKIKENSTNYTGVVISLKSFSKLNGLDNLKSTLIFFNQVLVPIKTEEKSIGIYFPVETVLSQVFLSKNNLFRDKLLNEDKDKAGYFEASGRIKCIKLKGNKSEGFWLPIDCLKHFCDVKKLKEGDEFNYIDDNLICEKYIIKSQESSVEKTKGKKIKKTRESKLLDNQFKLHTNTAQLKKNIEQINPNDIISITNKIHGTSFVVGNVLIKKKLSFFEKFIKKIWVNIVDTEYDIIYSSRNVVKNQYIEEKEQNHYYSYDLWSEISKSLETKIPEGFTLYGECYGFLKYGGYIQKDYDYNCEQNENKIAIYRITFTNIKGVSSELTWGQIKEFCKKYNIETVPEFFYGKAKDLYPELSIYNHWHENFIINLIRDYDNNKMCDICKNKVPAEGVVLKKDSLFYNEVFKLKQNLFYEFETKNLDKGIENIEDQN